MNEELAVGHLYPLLFKHSSFVKFPQSSRGRKGEEARGVSVYLHSSRIAGLS